MNQIHPVKLLPVALLVSLVVGGCASSETPEATSDEAALTTCFGFGPAVTAPIEAKYLSLGGCLGFLGAPVHEQRVTPDGQGRYMAFVNGSIYWRADLGAHVVRGEIRELWREFNWEAGPLGYPLTDETVAPDGVGRFGHFEGGSIYWTAETGAHEVRGAIRDKWIEMGAEAGPLGYPIAGEQATSTGVLTFFQRGTITWTRATGLVAVAITG